MTTQEQQFTYLRAMGIQTWVRRDKPVLDSLPELESAVTVLEESPLSTEEFSPGIDLSAIDLQEENETLGKSVIKTAIDTRQWDWPALQSVISSCSACDLHKRRIKAVFGMGDPHAQWMIIGEAPGEDEDKQGEPFVGQAGQLLNNMLSAIGLKREQIFITNILKCHPPDNRNPRVEEIAQCEGYLKRQIELVSPKVILAVGRVAAHNLLKVDTPLSRLRGKTHHYGQIPVVVTYHPAYLLRSPKEKAKSWDDLCFADSVVKGEPR